MSGRKSPVRQIILISQAPIIKGGLVARRFDEDPVYFKDIARMTGAVLDKRRKGPRRWDSVPTEDGDLLANELDSDPTKRAS